MRWYLNDVSLQGQFLDRGEFEIALRQLFRARARMSRWQLEFRTTRTFSQRNVDQHSCLRDVVYQSEDSTLKGDILRWLEHVGPFVEDDRLVDAEDYFEFAGLDVTDSGLGEAARRVRSAEVTSTFSFGGGAIDFALTPLTVDHGLQEDRLGVCQVPNVWTIEEFERRVQGNGLRAKSWKELVEQARLAYPRLVIPNSVYENNLLAREPFDAVIRDRALVLFGYLNRYLEGLTDEGSLGVASQEILDNFFAGDRALFTGESETNRKRFRQELTFSDPTQPGRKYFAHWHGKISHRCYRLHFEWPLPPRATSMMIAYLGPKLTKD